MASSSNQIDSEHPLRVLKKKQKNKEYEENEGIELCYLYIVNTLAQSSCCRPGGFSNRTTTCSCMKILAEEDNQPIANNIARYMVLQWAPMKLDTRRAIMFEWDRYASSSSERRKYLLPMCPPEEEELEPETQIKVCRNAITGILDIGRRLLESSLRNPGKKHGHTGAESNNRKALTEVYESMDVFFEKLKTEAQPFATRIIREETGTTTRDDDPDDVSLPPYFTKHKIYAMWCFERGRVVAIKSKAQGILRAQQIILSVSMMMIVRSLHGQLVRLQRELFHGQHF